MRRILAPPARRESWGRDVAGGLNAADSVMNDREACASPEIPAAQAKAAMNVIDLWQRVARVPGLDSRATAIRG